MAKKAKEAQSKKKAEPSGKAPKQTIASAIKPPDSAENFEHVLRRLFSQREA